MQRFDASIRGAVWWLILVVPPVGFWLLVQVLAYRAGTGTMPLREIYLLVALAQALPLAALAWMLCSVCAYTIMPGKLIVHRVVGDREFVLDASAAGTRCGGVVTVRLHGRTLRLRVAEAEACLACLRDAMPTAPPETESAAG